MQSFFTKSKRLLRFPLGPVVIASAALIFFWPIIPGKAADPKPQEVGKPSGPPPSLAIPVADVAAKAMEVSNLLRGLNTSLAPSPEIEKIREELPEADRNIDLQSTVTREILKGRPTLETLQAQQQIWQGLERQRAGWLRVLTARANRLQGSLDQLTELQRTWTLTLQSAKASKAPAPILRRIEGTLTDLGAAQALLSRQRTAVLDLQSKVANEAARCKDTLGAIAQAQQTAVGGIFTRERPPIWSADLWAHVQTTLPTRIPEVGAAFETAVREYLSDPSRGFPLQAGVFVALALFFGAARRQKDRWVASGEGVSSSGLVFDRPYAAALIGLLLPAAGPFAATPPIVQNIFTVLAVFPMIRLIQPVAPPPVIPFLYILGTLFALDTVRQAFAGVPLIEQAILVLESLAGVVVLGWIRYRRIFRRRAGAEGESFRFRAFEAGRVLLLFSLAAGLAAAAFGYLSLARFMVPGVLAGGVLALIILALFLVANGAVAFALRVRPLRLLKMVQHHRGFLERRVSRWLAWLAVFTWVFRSLDYIGLLDPILSAGGVILATKLERGSISISVGDIVSFFLTMLLAYLLSAFIRFVLHEDVYPRIGLRQGLSYATSSLLHYILLTLGFVVGVGVLGVNLTQMAFLAGALGVGIGFGLQGVVNNFVSGLILLFERPIQVGDTVEIGNLEGKMVRIGIRASMVRTWQGADVIVPNAQLTSDKVTNWTLSDQLRRIDLPVGVNYRAQPPEVIKILETVAAAHPKILRNPPPEAFFIGYGESSINFEMRAWTDHFGEWFQIRSDLAVALYDAVHKAGMSFPFPQREVRLLSDSAAGAGANPNSPAPLPEGRAGAGSEKI